MRPFTVDRASPRKGLTLLEVALAVAVAGVILTGAYGIAVTAFELTAEAESAQRRATAREALCRFLERQFREIPPEADITLEAGDQEGIPVSVLRVRGAPQSFSFRTAGARIDEVELRTEPEPGGTRRLRLTHRSGTDVVSSLVLMRGLFQCDWRMRETSAREWQSVWKTNGTARPRWVELQLAYPAEPSVRHLFWIPRLAPAPLPVAGSPVPPPTP
jgi:prepilin-type N-terminal cleavage/methylation domain-containing protein